jgi:RHS repeat-associated protein
MVSAEGMLDDANGDGIYEWGKRYYYHDHLGSIRALIDGNGKYLANYEYWPYGEEMTSSTYNEDSYRYTGHERDYDLNMDYMRTRHYRYLDGRFHQPDPVNGTTANPLNWNLYTYTYNNPLNLSDPFGLYTVICSETDEKCKENERAFELQRKRLSFSEDTLIAAAASAYGELGEINGIVVKFESLKGNEGAKTEPIASPNMDTGILNFKFNVYIDPKIMANEARFAAAIGHEGQHILDVKKFAETVKISSDQISYDPARRLTIEQTEKNAYLITHKILSHYNAKLKYDGGTLGGKNMTEKQVLREIEKILKGPTYKNKLNNPWPDWP